VRGAVEQLEPFSGRQTLRRGWVCHDFVDDDIEFGSSLSLYGGYYRQKAGEEESGFEGHFSSGL
jgi:hypothetical protein